MKIRISAGNLALVARNRDTGAWAYVGLVNKGFWEKKKQRVLTPPGGALLARALGEQQLIRNYGAVFQGDREEHGIDARFLIDDVHLDRVLNLIETGGDELFERDVEREVIEELATAEIAGLQTDAVLAAEDLSDMKAVYLGAYRQPVREANSETSVNAGAEPTRRLFFCWGIIVGDTVWQKLAASPIVELLDAEEVSTTNGGLNKGKSKQGSVIGDNLFTLPPEWEATLLA